MAKTPHEHAKDPDDPRWSVEGIDPAARSAAREAAQRQGLTLGAYLNSVLLGQRMAVEGEPASFGGDAPANTDDAIRRMAAELEQISQRVENSTSRSARAISAIDKSVLGLMGKVDASGKAQLFALERVTLALNEIELAQLALKARIHQLEADSALQENLSAKSENDAAIVAAFVSEFSQRNSELDALHHRLTSPSRQEKANA